MEHVPSFCCHTILPVGRALSAAVCALHRRRPQFYLTIYLGWILPHQLMMIPLRAGRTPLPAPPAGAAGSLGGVHSGRGL